MTENLKAIQSELNKLNYSKDAVLDMINLLNRAITISKNENSDRRTNNCLNNLIQTKEKELNELLEGGISEENRKERFEIAKSHFQADLLDC